MLSPGFPIAAATTTQGISAIRRVIARRKNGRTFQEINPSQMICPTIVAMMEELCPEKNRARANNVPATGERVVDNKAWMEKRSSPFASSEPKRAVPATIRIAELTNSANVEREITTSVIEYESVARIAKIEGRHLYPSPVSLNSFRVVLAVKFPDTREGDV